MAIFKCKMCGGTLEINDGESIAICEYCGTKQTIPTAKDEALQGLFNRANILRMKSEFDKSEQLYEKIIQADQQQAEAYWGLILCKYGIEYVEDPKTFKRIPTCHRASFESIISDDDYKSALEYADYSQRTIYEEEAKEIDRLQKEILELSKKEAPYDVFICYKETDDTGARTQDSVIANDIYYQLTQEGLKVFYAAITLEDELGSAYEPCIFAALNSAKVMLSIGTKPEYFNAVWVKNEWSRFLKLMKNDRSKMLIPCYRDMDAYELPEEFAHLQAQDMSKIGFINDLVRGISKVVKKEEVGTISSPETVVIQTNSNIEPLLKRMFMFLEDGNFKSADEYAEKVLDINPECAEAYLGKAFSSHQLKSASKISIRNFTDLENDVNYLKFLKFATDSKKSEICEIINQLKEEKRKNDEENYHCLLNTRKRIKAANLNIVTCNGRTIGLKSDGTVVVAGDRACNQWEVEYWYDIVAVATCVGHTVGLKSDGTVIAVGGNKYGQCNVSDWYDIVAIATYGGHTVGLKADGTVVAVGDNSYGQCNVSDWRDIMSIATYSGHTVGLKADGTVIAVGDNKYGQCNVSDWHDIVAISGTSSYTVGLKLNGTVVVVGSITGEKHNVSDWHDIAAVSAGPIHIAGLKADGTVVGVGDNWGGHQCNVSDWHDIVAVSTGPVHIAGLKSDGTVVVAGDNSKGQCNVSNWKLFDNLDNLEEESALARKKVAEKRRKEEEERKKMQELRASRRIGNRCQHCGGEFKGLFTKKCVNCGKTKDY